MSSAAAGAQIVPSIRFLDEAPADLTARPLKRLGEGIGRIVYASEHWVVTRERSPSEVVALIVLWRLLRRMERILPWGIGQRLLDKPSRQIRFLRVTIQSAMAIIPKSVWFRSRVRQTWKVHFHGATRGQKVADAHLTGSSLVPERVQFPPTKLRVRGWPGWLMVSEAAERVDATLYERLVSLARKGDFAGIEQWLDRFLATRLAGWRMGVFSTDSHLKNYGVCGEQIVLLDTGGLTNRWEEVEKRLALEETTVPPHVRLGLGAILAARPDIAERFNAGWKAILKREVIEKCWQGDQG